VLNFSLAPIWVSILGLVGCLFLAFWAERQTWLIGLGLALVGLLWHALASILAKAEDQ
jgi:hypothetical protein